MLLGLSSFLYTNCSKGFGITYPIESESLESQTESSTTNLTPIASQTSLSNGDFIPSEISPAPESPLPVFEKKTYSTSSFNGSFAIVFVRIPRTTGAIDYVTTNGIKKPHMKNWDLLQTLPETSHRLSNISGPGQLVYRDRAGNEKVIFDCMISADCLPMDPSLPRGELTYLPHIPGSFDTG